MNNYQLYRTNVLLGGQMRWDLTLDSIQGRLQVSDFHLSPISKWIPYNRFIDEDLLNYSHKDNIRSFYKKIGDYFYSESVDPKLLLRQPIIVKEGEEVDTYNDIYDLGLSRLSYKLTGKSFQYFCPLWLEDFGEDDKIKFEFVFRSRTIGDDGEFSFNDYISKSFVLENSDLYGEYHNKFVDYFTNYVKYVSVDDKIGDNIINVDYKNNFISVDGVSVESGDARTVNSSLIVSNLYSRERPLMEFDQMLVDNVKNNKLVVKQLFNFNFLFNVEDIIDKTVLDMLYGDYINILVRVYISRDEKYELLDTVSFDTNYEFVDRGDGVIDKDGVKAKGTNVLDYMKDYNCVDLVDKNKVYPDIFHWSLRDDPGSYFNIYSGFETHPMYMYDQVSLWRDGCDDRGNKKPSLSVDDYVALDWCRCNTVDLDNISDYLIMSNIKDESSHPYLSLIDLNKPFIRGCKMKNPLSVEIDTVSDTVSVGILRAFSRGNKEDNRVVLKQTIRGIVNNDDALYEIDGNSGLFIYRYDPTRDNKILFINVVDPNEDDSNDRLLMYKNIKNKIKEIADSTNLEWLKNSLTTLYTYLTNIEEPVVIKIENSLSMTKANSPSYVSSEIEYEKEDNVYQYHLRYDGVISPRFSSDVTSYKVKTVTQEDYIRDWSKYSEFLPLYPSCKYFYLETADDKSSLKSNGECRWFDESTYLIVDTEDVVVMVQDQKNNPKTLDDIVRDYIYTRYQQRIDERVKKKKKENPNADEDELKRREIDYIFDLYDYVSDYEYESLNNTDKYRYTIKITLK